MSSLERARNFAPDVGVEVLEPVRDQHGWRIAWDAQLDNGRSAYLFAAGFHAEEGIGMGKSMDYHLIASAFNESPTRYILLYLESRTTNKTIYKADPADIMSAIEQTREWYIDPEDLDEGFCPLCAEEMEPEHQEKSSAFPGDAFEIHNHRLKYHVVPFHQIYLENLRGGASNPPEPHEEDLLNELRSRGIKVRYTGNQPGERQLFGFCPDFVLYEHQGVGCRLIELGKHRASVEEDRRQKAREKGCQVLFLRYSPEEVRENVEEIVEQVEQWVRQSDLERYGIADD